MVLQECFDKATPCSIKIKSLALVPDEKGIFDIDSEAGNYLVIRDVDQVFLLVLDDKQVKF